jgi:RNA polymerase sigma-70 factor (ECF subfamily)
MEGMVGSAAPGWDDVVDEAALLAGLRAGDEKSFESMVRTWCGRMLAVARRLLGSEEDARDCVQEAFLNAFQKLSAFEGRSSLGTWLHRIVVNQALSKLRARGRRPEESLDGLLPTFDASGHRLGPRARPTVSVQELAARNEVREVVQRSIARLPDPYRVVLLLCDIEGYNTEEAAGLLGITEGALKVRLHRARSALRALLEPVLRGEVR